MDAIDLIAAERRRQIEREGWTPEHDDEHEEDELARAAACYALPCDLRRSPYPNETTPPEWPWAEGWWKPTPDDRIRELVKAGALIVAEIERLQRAAIQGSSPAARLPADGSATGPEGSDA